MSSLFRLLILLPIAFVAGVVWERGRAGDLCDRAGGEMINNVCTPGETR